MVTSRTIATIIAQTSDKLKLAPKVPAATKITMPNIVQIAVEKIINSNVFFSGQQLIFLSSFCEKQLFCQSKSVFTLSYIYELSRARLFYLNSAPPRATLSPLAKLAP
jgi:hypothetical protein